jgi:hypothetical protein
MTIAAWCFMLAVWAIIIGSTVYCFYKLLLSKKKLGEDWEQEVIPPTP